MLLFILGVSVGAPCRMTNLEYTCPELAKAELNHGEEQATPAMDVFAFGRVAYSMYTACPFWPNDCVLPEQKLAWLAATDTEIELPNYAIGDETTRKFIASLLIKAAANRRSTEGIVVSLCSRGSQSSWLIAFFGVL